jgi:hypothetical protein
MANKLLIKIADIVFSLIGEKEIYRFKDNVPYNLFFAEGNAEVILRFRTGSPIQENKNLPGEILFDTQPIWRLYYSNKKYILQTRHHTAILTPDFTSGEIYITKNPRSFPFTYPLDEILMINLLSKGRGVMAHACGLQDNRKGMLFAGESGAGKSTLCNLWKDKKDVTVLSDDRIIIRKMEGRYWMYGTPWHGEANLCSPEKAPLEKIFFLKHAQKNSVKKMAPMEAASRLMVCSFPTFWDKKGMEFTLGFIDELIRKIPCYELGFVPDKTAVDFVKNI